MVKGWSLINKDTGKIIKIGLNKGEIYVLAFETKKGLLEYIGKSEYDEEIKRVEIL
jgi:hypothetical protein